MKLSSVQTKQLLTTLENEFAENMQRHKGLQWGNVETVLKNPLLHLAYFGKWKKRWAADVVSFDKKTGQFTFFDCSPESPTGRRSLCYDNKALDDRKENKPKGSALGLAAEMGVEILSEEQYKFLQTLGKFDLKNIFVVTYTAFSAAAAIAAEQEDEDNEDDAGAVSLPNKLLQHMGDSCSFRFTLTVYCSPPKGVPVF